MQLAGLNNILCPSALLSRSSKVSVRPLAAFIRSNQNFIEILDEAALKRRPNRNGGLIIPDKTRLWGAAITRAKYKRHDMPYYGKPTTLTALVLGSIYHFRFHAGWAMQQDWGKQLCFVLALCHFLSYQVRRGGPSSWLELPKHLEFPVAENKRHGITVLCLLGVLLPDTGLTEPDVSNSSAEDHEDNS